MAGPDQERPAERPGAGTARVRAATLAAPLAVALAAAAAFAPSLDGEFLNWDDDRFVVGNERVAGLGADNLAWAFFGVRFELYQPLYLVSFMIDGSLWGGSPLGYRLHNLALYAACALLVLALLGRLGFGRLPAAAGALLFAVAPYHAESVAWISSRKDLLMLLFGLAAWRVHLIGTASRAGAIAGRALTALLLVAALLSKSGAAAFPALMLAADVALLRAGWRRSLLRIAPCLLPAAAAAASAPLLWGDVGLIARPADASALGRLGLVGWTAAHYLGTAAWPFDLSPLYAEPTLPEQRLGAALGAAALALAVAGVAVARARGAPWRPWAAALAIFALGIAPYLNAVPLYYVVADRYLLLPSIGLSIAAAALAERALAARRAAVRRVGAGALTAALAVLGVTAGGEAASWRTSLSLWSHAVSREPDAFFARLKYGETLRAAGDPAASADQYREARRIRPGSPTALGGVFWGELLADARDLGIRSLDDERIVSRFLAAADDGAKLLPLSLELRRRGFRRAAAVAEGRFREWRYGAPP